MIMFITEAQIVSSIHYARFIDLLLAANSLVCVFCLSLYEYELKREALISINYQYHFEKLFDQIYFHGSELESFLINLKM